ncbi:DUF4773 domain-containing protein [Trichonephila clavipes]|nr:DUF4773 domain-containing protein [Trichonephila clavipes]
MAVWVSLIFVFVNSVSSYVTDNSTVPYLEEGSHSGCQCVKFECECCLVVDIPEIKLDNTICLQTAYLSKEYGVSVSLTMDDKVLIKQSVSARNPPPVCLPIPFLKKYVHLCLTVYNLSISGSNFGACAKLDLLIWYLCKLGNVQIGCFDTRTHSLANPIPDRILVRRKREALTDIRKQHRLLLGPGCKRSTALLGIGGSTFITRKSGYVQIIRTPGGPPQMPNG